MPRARARDSLGKWVATRLLMEGSATPSPKPCRNGAVAGCGKLVSGMVGSRPKQWGHPLDFQQGQTQQDGGGSDNIPSTPGESIRAHIQSCVPDGSAV